MYVKNVTIIVKITMYVNQKNVQFVAHILILTGLINIFVNHTRQKVRWNMTREEAINKAWVYLTSCFPLPIEDVDEIMQAIEQPCKDAVSRKAVLESLNCEISGQIISGTDLSKYQRKFQEFGRMILNAQEKAIKELPSVTPVACIAEFRFSKEDMQEIVDEKIKDIVVERKKGHWIMTNDYLTAAYESIDYVKCSCCGEESLEEGNYCPNCGAEMQGVEE